MKIMVREMSLIRGLGAPAKEMSFPHHLAMFKDHPRLLLPTISRHFPRFPAKKMSQSLVALQYGRRSRVPGRVPRAAQRQPGCTAEQTNHEPRSFLVRGASRREFRGFHESRDTKHESRLFFDVGAPGWRRRKPPSGPLRPPASHCFPVHRCSSLFTIVHDCSLLFAIVRHCSDENIVRSQPACLTTRRGEVGERAVRTRREPLGARRRTLRVSGRQTFLLEQTKPPA